MAISPVYPLSNRPVAMGVNGMVAAAHPLASQAGLRILMQGGNAIDAAVATAAALNVVEPYMSGMGGIGLALVHLAKERRIRALNFSGRMPKSAYPDRFTEETKGTGILASLVPGNVAGWLTMHEQYGTLELDQVFGPAIDYAENGFPITNLNSRSLRTSADRLSEFPSVRLIRNRAGGPPAPGTRHAFPELAESFREVVRGGKETFYRGALADRIVKGNQKWGGLFTHDDLAEYEAEWQEPISISYRGYRVHTPAPNSSGFQLLATLKCLEGFKGEDLVFQHPETLHLMAESIKLAATDRIRYAGDPDHVYVPVEGLISEGYAVEQRKRIDRGSAAGVSGEHYAREVAADALRPGNPEEYDGGMTTHFAVADRDGNVVTVTQTLGAGFGCGAAVGDTGFFLNNMAFWFDLEEGAPNRLEGGKRVDFCLAPTQTFSDGRLHLSLGTPGSWGILQTTPQLLMNVLDFGMNVQEAIEAPRLRVFEERRVVMEERFPAHVRAALTDKGHDVDLAEPFTATVGGAQAILIDHESGTFQGGADPRRDGAAIGF
jgi:gamma-glutamyltranspeptidase/glutathione hydrolase